MPPLLANNSAARMHDLLVKFRQVANKLGPGHSLREVWAGTLEMSGTELEDLYNGLIEVGLLTRRVNTDVAASPFLDRELYLASFGRVRGLLNPAKLETDWREHSEAFNDVVLTELKLTAHSLGQHHPESTVTDDELSKARESLGLAYKAVVSTPMDDEARNSLLFALGGMRSALARYRTAGIQAFWETWTQMLGTLMSEAKRSPDFQETYQSPTMAPFREAVGFVAKLAATAKGAQAIVDLARLIGGAVDKARQLGDGAAQ
jgi:hypothetical protein